MGARCTHHLHRYSNSALSKLARLSARTHGRENRRGYTKGDKPRPGRCCGGRPFAHALASQYPWLRPHSLSLLSQIRRTAPSSSAKADGGSEGAWSERGSRLARRYRGAHTRHGAQWAKTSRK